VNVVTDSGRAVRRQYVGVHMHGGFSRVTVSNKKRMRFDCGSSCVESLLRSSESGGSATVAAQCDGRTVELVGFGLL
jgi:hypothetical protein